MIGKLKIWPAYTEVCSGNNVAVFNTEGKNPKNYGIQNLLDSVKYVHTDFRFCIQPCTVFFNFLGVFSVSFYFFQMINCALLELLQEAKFRLLLLWFIENLNHNIALTEFFTFSTFT